jgi:hypothetical protein
MIASYHVWIRNDKFLPRVNKKQNVEIDSAAWSRGRGQYILASPASASGSTVNF